MPRPLLWIVFLSTTFIGSTEVLLAGPLPNGWVVSDDLFDLYSLALDLAILYEEPSKESRFSVYTNGYVKSRGSIATNGVSLMSIGQYPSRYEANFLYNYYVNCFLEIGQLNDEEEGMFDFGKVENYADTIVRDVFELEGHVNDLRGIEKEAALIFGIWMKIFQYMNLVRQECDGTSDINRLLKYLDSAVALWIGVFQVHGDNTQGTMLYNLAERAAFNFNDNSGESTTNTELKNVWETMKNIIVNRRCSNDDDELYGRILEALGLMNVPIIQNLIHYIMIGAHPGLIELYLLALLPQIRSCNQDYFAYFLDQASKLASDDYTDQDMTSFIQHLQSMYDCLGVSCDDVGIHASGISCVDDEVDPIISFAGYIPSSEVRGYSKFDRDANQVSILLQEKNIPSAIELYSKGKNALLDGERISLQRLANAADFSNSVVYMERLYDMYKEYYGGYDFADRVVLEVFADSALAKSAVPILIKAMISPHYAVRSFFAANDVCSENSNEAKELWDRGVAVLIGSIDGANILGDVQDISNGHSWYSLGKKYCRYFECKVDSFVPEYITSLLFNIELGRDAIKSHNCLGVIDRVRDIESLIMVPLLQGALYHSVRRHQGSGSIEEYAEAYAFGKSIVPVISVANSQFAATIEDLLFTAGTFDVKSIWTVILSSISDLGIDCHHLGSDTFQLFDGKDFCSISSDLSNARI